MSFTPDEKKEYWKSRSIEKVRQSKTSAMALLVESMRYLDHSGDLTKEIRKAFGSVEYSFIFLDKMIKGDINLADLKPPKKKNNGKS